MSWSAGPGQLWRNLSTEPILSPDSTREVFIQNYNVAFREVGADPGDYTMLTWEGTPGNTYTDRSIVWSPDSRKVAVYRVVPGQERSVHYVESSPKDQLQPRHSTFLYAKPGDRLDKEIPVILDAESGRQMIIDDALFPNAYTLSRLEWRERADASALLATGWQYPEVFVANGRDGVADIWGIIIRPTNFDPNRSYPVIESIYAGPHGSHVPKTFSTHTGRTAVPELGFIVAQIDGMGTNNRMDKIWWNEAWMGWPIGPHYSESSNVDNAWPLQGKLLLVVGELDRNVDPSSTLQVVNALIDADKDFDFLLVPGAGHGSGGDFGVRKRNDYFVRHLLGVEPPSWEQYVASDGESDR